MSSPARSRSASSLSPVRTPARPISDFERKVNSLRSVSPKKLSPTKYTYVGGVVGSGRGFFYLHGQCVAMPHTTLSPNRTKSVPVIPTGTSEYRSKFKDAPFCYSSMDKKPLQKYDPLAFRSRNAMPDVVMPEANASIVDLDCGMINRTPEPFKTTQQTYHDGEVPSYVSNVSILAEQLRNKRHAQLK